MEEEKQRGKGHRLLLMPSPLQGHITPFLHLGDILFSKGFSITILHTIFNSPNPSSYPHFTFHAIPDGLSETEASTLDAVLLTDLINIRCKHPLKEWLASSVLSHQESVSCFISDAALHFTQPVCDELKLPRLVLRTGGASSFLVFASFPLLRDKGYLPVQGFVLINFFSYTLLSNVFGFKFQNDMCLFHWLVSILYTGDAKLVPGDSLFFRTSLGLLHSSW